MNYSIRKPGYVLLVMFSFLTAYLVPAWAEEAPAPLENHSILWNGWGKEAFERARADDKLIFLDVSAKWCHWCKVMDETTYKDPRVIELLNKEFVPVYVDADSRPDINDRYNQGGWPSVAVLTPAGDVLAGRTTVSAEDLVSVLSATNLSYKTARDRVYQKVEAGKKARQAAKEEREKAQDFPPLSAEMPFMVLRAINLFVEPVYGGYGGPDKFPLPELLEFGLYVYPKARDYKDQSPGSALELTLKGMAEGLLDKVEGGFFRYSTTADWKSPHYEKLLSTNGDLLGIYMQAYQLLDSDRYRRTADSVAGYLEGTLFDIRTGAFFNSQAADEQYYKLGKGERAGRKSPPVDKAIYADSNAKAALGYLMAYRATGEGHYLKTALGVLDYIMGTLYRKNLGVLHSSTHDTEALNLSDQVYPALAAEQAYQATGDRRYLEFAVDVSSLMGKGFWDPEKGGFFDTCYVSEPAGLLKDRKKPQIESSKASILLMDLYHITGQEVYRETARRALTPFTSDYNKYSFWAAPFALAVERCIEPAYEFIVVGRPGTEGAGELVKTAYTFEEPDRVVVHLDPDRDKKRLADLGYEYSGKPVLYVCSDKTCFSPVYPGDSLKKTRKYIQKSREQERK